uniref:Uncharacterized protein n=1 Tax=Opuntia streptacantha TaxID=393608 RepID=A0A7C9DTP2_OPUST
MRRSEFADDLDYNQAIRGQDLLTSHFLYLVRKKVGKKNHDNNQEVAVLLLRVELKTSRLLNGCSNQLSYKSTVVGFTFSILRSSFWSLLACCRIVYESLDWHHWPQLGKVQDCCSLIGQPC